MRGPHVRQKKNPTAWRRKRSGIFFVINHPSIGAMCRSAPRAVPQSRAGIAIARARRLAPRRSRRRGTCARRSALRPRIRPRAHADSQAERRPRMTARGTGVVPGTPLNARIIQQDGNRRHQQHSRSKGGICVFISQKAKEQMKACMVLQTFSNLAQSS